MGQLSQSCSRMGLEDEIAQSDWQTLAACRGAGAELFFPGREAGAAAKIIAAKKLCATCPVQQECLQYALFVLPHEQRRFGIWGGLTEKERRKLRNTLNRNGRKSAEEAA
jgi:WhiB family redox-sensing transcriptional regulator